MFPLSLLETHFYRARQRLLMVALIALGMVACGGGPDAPAMPAPKALKFEGLDADAQAQLAAAQSEVMAAPTSAQANAKIARLLHAYTQLQPAVAYYSRARRLAPGDFELAYLHGLALGKTGPRDDAIQALRRARELNPSYVPVQLMLADLLADAGDSQASRELYEAVLQVSPDLPQALLGLGQLRLADDAQAALALMRRAATVSGSYGAAHYAIAQVLRDSGDNEGARVELALFERYQGKAPYLNDPVMGRVRLLNLSHQGHLERAINAYGAGRLEVSAREFEKSLEKDPGNVMARQNLIAVYGQLGQYDAAESHYRLAIGSNPNVVQLHTNYALLQLKKQNFAKAIEAYETAIEVDPGFGKSYIGIGTIHAAQGDHAEALNWYRAALNHDPDNRQARQYLASALIQRGLLEQAIEILEPAVSPDDVMSAAYLHMRARAQAATGRFDDAEQSLLRAEQLALRFKKADLARVVKQDLGRLRMARLVAEER